MQTTTLGDGIEAPSEVSLPLRISARSRLIALLRALVPILEGVVFMIVAFTVGASGQPLAERAATLLSMWPLGLVFVSAGVLLLRPALVRRARVVVEPGGVRIEHPGILRTPFIISGRDISKVVISSEPTRPGRFAFADQRRFALDNHGTGPGWLYARTSGSPFPLLAHSAEPPNVLLVFTRPIVFATVRRSLRPFSSLAPTHILRARQPTFGILMRVRDPDTARRAFGAYDVVRPLTNADLERVAPGVAAFNRTRTNRTRAFLGLALVLAINVAGPIATFGPGPADKPTSSGR